MGRSCKVIQRILETRGIPKQNGVYTIQPTDDLTLNAYCDFERDGGGWTLLVSSHSNTWNPDNIPLRNANSPQLFEDYSILKYGDSIKDHYLLSGKAFQYRLEADHFGRSF